MPFRKLTREERNLVHRYLLWCYKTTKEELDRIDRKFTQLAADRFVLNELRKNKKLPTKNLHDFESYITNKERDALAQKFTDSKHTRLNPDYVFFKSRLAAIEKSIVYFLGQSQLRVIKSLYEQEMIRRVLESREHT